MTLKKYILHQLCEMQREVTAVLRGLSPEQLNAHPPGQKNHIAWIVQHCCINVDALLHRSTTGRFAISHTDRFIDWPTSPPEDGYSTVGRVLLKRGSPPLHLLMRRSCSNPGKCLVKSRSSKVAFGSSTTKTLICARFGWCSAAWASNRLLL